MHSAKIKYLIAIRTGKSQKQIAGELQCSMAMLSMLISHKKKSRRLANRLAEMIGKKPSNLFPWYRAA